MDIFPSEQEIDQAADLLVDKYNISPQLLGDLLGKNQRDQANALLQRLGNRRPDKSQVAHRLVRRKGPELFSGSTKYVRELRLKLLDKLPNADIVDLYDLHGPKKKKITSPSRMRRPLAHMKWVARGPWPIRFVNALRFPEIFAGVRQTNPKPTIEDVPPLGRPPELENFQVYLKERMLQVLEQEGNKTRCMVTLPTGGGKTRIAVEAFVDWMQQRFANGQYMLWIAQSEELCEQAVAHIQQMWGSKEYPSKLRVYRYFGARDIPIHELRGGAIVSSIQQLHSRIKGKDRVLDEVLRKTGAMIIDEAHRAVSEMYTTLLDKAEQSCGPELFPICGLTATPGRAGIYGEEETLLLADRFQWHLVPPNLGQDYENDPLKYFIDKGYLAHPQHVVVHSRRAYTLTDEEVEAMKLEPDLPSGFLKRLADDKRRNDVVVRRLLKLPTGTPTLVYACTVEHAYFLSDILEDASGRRAAALSSDTPMTIRRGLIEKFKRGEIDFLCNFGVLTTGFDAPKTECIAITRPTTSEVLYEQIVGRGLRGPKFSGTNECLVIDFADNIKRLGRPLSYARFKHPWATHKVEN
ncbi:MAG: DEAD/DEAH box helicase [Dehalococcoidia bacterium]